MLVAKIKRLIKRELRLVDPDFSNHESAVDIASNTQSNSHARFQLWPRKLLGPAPGAKELNIVLWSILLTCFAGPLIFQAWSRLKVGPFGDFVYFYGDGLLANRHPPTQLYNYTLQLEAFDEIDPTRGNLYGPSPYPPFVALFFGLMARTSYRTAYVLWFILSLGLYAIGVELAIRQAFPQSRLKRSLCLCLAFAFPPFLVNTLLSGQISSISACAVGLGVANDRSKPLLSGLALSLLTYKPTLLLVILPMLILQRRGRSLLGFCIGAFALSVAATIVDGRQIWPAYLAFLSFFRHVSQTPGALKRWQFVDLSSFASLTLGSQPKIEHFVFVVGLLGVSLCLAVLFWKSASRGDSVAHLVWAITLTWTLLLNVYMPIYDSILIVPSAILTLGVLDKTRRIVVMQWTLFLSVTILFVSWKSEIVAKTYGIQPLTILLLLFGVWQLILLRGALRSASLCPIPAELPE